MRKPDTVTAELVVKGVEPPNGSPLGGTVVNVTGVNFESGNIACKFGTLAPVMADVFHSSSFIVCTTPAHVSGVVSLEVSNNNADFHNSSVTYRYDGITNAMSYLGSLIAAVPAHVYSLLPEEGPEMGGVLCFSLKLHSLTS